MTTTEELEKLRNAILTLREQCVYYEYEYEPHWKKWNEALRQLDSLLFSQIPGCPGRNHALVRFIEAHVLWSSSVILALLVGLVGLFCALPAGGRDGVVVGILLLIAIPSMLGIIQTLIEDWLWWFHRRH